MVRRTAYEDHASAGSDSAGFGSPSRRHRSMRCSWDVERSFSSDLRHFAMTAPGVKVSIPHAFGDADDSDLRSMLVRSSGNALGFVLLASTRSRRARVVSTAPLLRSSITDAAAKHPEPNRFPKIVLTIPDDGRAIAGCHLPIRRA